MSVPHRYVRADSFDHACLQVSIAQQFVIDQSLIVAFLELVLPVYLGEGGLELLDPKREAAWRNDFVRLGIASKSLTAT